MTQQVEYIGPDGVLHVGIAYPAHRDMHPQGKILSSALNRARAAWRNSSRPEKEWPAWVSNQFAWEAGMMPLDPAKNP